MNFSREDIEEIIIQKLSILDNEESKNKTEDLRFPLIYDAFNSKFGKNLEEKCRDLTLFIEASMLLISIIKKREKLQQNIHKLFEGGLEMSLEEEEDSEARQFAEAVEPLKSFIFSKDSSDSDDKEPDVLSKKGIQELRIVQRCSAYYILALYAYIDVYLEQLFEKYFKKKIPKDESKFLLNFPERGGIKKRVKYLSQIIKRELPEQFDEFYMKYDGLNDKIAFELLIETRHKVAHKNPLPELNKLRSRFRKHYKKAKEHRDILIEGISNFKFFENDEEDHKQLSINMKANMTKLFNLIFKDIHLAFFFLEVGLSCIRYLALIEELARKKYKI